MFDDGWKKHYTERVACMDNGCHADFGSRIQARIVMDFDDAGYDQDIPYCPFCGKQMEEVEQE